MTKCISILGSTGSIGTQTLEVVDQLGLQVAALTARSNVDLMEQQARKYLPRLVVLYDETRHRRCGNGFPTKKKQKCAPVWKACFVLLWWMKPTLC